tara:strand:- start:12474 stop:13082 length:609 start_codon:yes stop_codon:yes gene_type:complete
MKRVLIACEFSGVVRRAFRERGFDAWSCDIDAAADNSPYHYQCDVREILDDGWDLMIAHPPCTYIANSGVSRLHQDKGRWKHLAESISLFNTLLNADIPRICVENPIPHKYAVEDIGNYDQIIHPHMFGHKEQKATCLWLKGLPLLQITNDVKQQTMILPIPERQRVYWLGSGKGKERSVTYEGIADAMAKQWGDLVLQRWV